jgi:hypothetical protein
MVSFINSKTGEEVFGQVKGWHIKGTNVDNDAAVDITMDCGVISFTMNSEWDTVLIYAPDGRTLKYEYDREKKNFQGITLEAIKFTYGNKRVPSDYEVTYEVSRNDLLEIIRFFMVR